MGGLLGFGALGYGGEGAFGRQWPLELCQRRAQRVEARGAGGPVLLDGTFDGCGYCGVFVVSVKSIVSGMSSQRLNCVFACR